jgi:hypothetical protein
VTTRYLVLAAGVGYRWHDHLGVPKHLLRLDGEELIHRTVRQLADRGQTDVWIVGPDDPRYRSRHAALWTPPRVDITGTQVDKFLSSRDLWHTGGPTVFMWGDVWWSDAGMDALTGYAGPDPWHVWYRPGPSKVTGCDTGEMFAHRFGPDLHTVEAAACARVVVLHRRGLVPWSNTGGWGHYRAMCGLPDEQVHGWTTPGHDHVTIVDDWTDDVDAPGDYVAWYGRRALGRYPVRVVFHDTRPAVQALWPDVHPGGQSTGVATVTVHGDLAIGFDQFWCAVAHAVEHQVPVVPYSHPTPMPYDQWEAEPMWTAHEHDTRIVVTPPAPPVGEPVRLYGHCWEVPNV